ncbi:CZB domain-containing protein [Sulfuricurvum sp.]|uniref:CZB domain-containing protein n=1 Tax=Sulfuricurvum sp. TaxID=2025608 RepID=UPI003BAF045F
MTNKEKSIHNLHQARTSHIRWVNTIKLLVSGIEVSEDSIQVNPTDALFGQWFYDEAMLFSLGTSRMVLEEIEILFLSLHDKYMKIYPIYYSSKKRSLLGGLIGGKSKASEHEIELSQRYYEEIVVLSDKLKHKLRILESQLMSLPLEKFDTVAELTKPSLSSVVIQQPIPEPVDNEETAYFYGTRGRG